MSVPEVRILGIPGIPIIVPGDDLVAIIYDAVTAADLSFEDGDVLVVTQKIVSKAENCLINLNDITPSPFAESLAQQWGKDPRSVEVVLQQSRRIAKMDRGLIIAETHHGFVCANAGVDQSNMDSDDIVAVLPPDPDGSARALRAGLKARTGIDVAVIICDTFGRPWRSGIVNVALGLSGIEALQDYTGLRDAHGYELRVTALCVADELSSAAELVMNKLDNVPVALIRGYPYPRGDGDRSRLVRDPDSDLFR